MPFGKRLLESGDAFGDGLEGKQVGMGENKIAREMSRREFIYIYLIYIYIYIYIDARHDAPALGTGYRPDRKITLCICVMYMYVCVHMHTFIDLSSISIFVAYDILTVSSLSNADPDTSATWYASANQIAQISIHMTTWYASTNQMVQF